MPPPPLTPPPAAPSPDASMPAISTASPAAPPCCTTSRRVKAARVLLVGLGVKAEFDAHRYHQACLAAGKAVSGMKIDRAATWLSALDVPGKDAAWRVRTAALAFDHATYRYTATFQDGPSPRPASSSAGPGRRGPGPGPGAGRRHGRGRVLRPPPGQHAAQHLRAGLDRAAGHRLRRGPRRRRHRGARARADAGPGHELAAGRGARIGQLAAPDRAEVERRQATATSPMPSSARASPSMPAA